MVDGVLIVLGSDLLGCSDLSASLLRSAPSLLLQLYLSTKEPLTLVAEK